VASGFGRDQRGFTTGFPPHRLRPSLLRASGGTSTIEPSEVKNEGYKRLRPAWRCLQHKQRIRVMGPLVRIDGRARYVHRWPSRRQIVASAKPGREGGHRAFPKTMDWKVGSSWRRLWPPSLPLPRADLRGHPRPFRCRAPGWAKGVDFPKDPRDDSNRGRTRRAGSRKRAGELCARGELCASTEEGSIVADTELPIVESASYVDGLAERALRLRQPWPLRGDVRGEPTK